VRKLRSWSNVDDNCCCSFCVAEWEEGIDSFSSGKADEENKEFRKEMEQRGLVKGNVAVNWGTGENAGMDALGKEKGEIISGKGGNEGMVDGVDEGEGEEGS